ncbi:MAG: LysR family transcriptional regulator [Ottowia sp.]|uniref:LysR family transcriptional regulator n=1 Tax=unclassified Ottowia TaxID=2645081 RepID=UPI003C3031E4
MTLKQLEAFYWAAKLGTFALAAQRLHVTQSSLSKRIAELEASLGQQLFTRTSRYAALTAAGETLLVKAGAMLEFERDIRASLGTRRQEIRGACRFGLTELAATTWFPAFAARLEQGYPYVVLEPRVGLSKPLELSVTRGELDLASIAGPVSASELQSRTVAEIQFIWTSSPTRLRRRTLLTRKDFEAHPVISNPQDSGLASAFDTWAQTNGMHGGKTIQCNSRAAIIALTIAGAGISFQPRKYVQPLIARGLLVPLESEAPIPPLPYNLIWRSDDDRPLIRTIVGLVQEEADFDMDNILWTTTVQESPASAP